METMFSCTNLWQRGTSMLIVHLRMDWR